MLTKTFQDPSLFAKRRHRLNEQAGEAVFILFSGEEGHLSLFRGNSHFVYLTGFEEPSSMAVIRTGKAPSFTLFVRDKDPSVEIWDGERFGPELTKTEFGVDQTFSIGEAEDQLKFLLQDAERIYFALGEDADNDHLVLSARDQVQQLQRRTGACKIPIFDPNSILSGMRMVKDEQEVQWMREVSHLSAKAHIHVMKNIKPGMNERQAQAHLYFSFYDQLAAREGYSSIIASGPNACTLHYRANNRLMEEGDLLLIDAGAEKNYYTADITRTYPVNGQFRQAQKKIYEAVLDVQKKLISMVKPGFSLPELHEKSCQLLTEKMVDLGLLKGTISELIAEKAYQKYYPHGIGHYLGLDVHDVGFSRHKGLPVAFVKNVVITVEPGLYVPPDDESAPRELRGLGVRIEDDVLVTDDQPEVLTALAPKEVDQLQNLIGSGLDHAK